MSLHFHSGLWAKVAWLERKFKALVESVTSAGRAVSASSFPLSDTRALTASVYDLVIPVTPPTGTTWFEIDFVGSARLTYTRTAATDLNACRITVSIVGAGDITGGSSTTIEVPDNLVVAQSLDRHIQTSSVFTTWDSSPINLHIAVATFGTIADMTSKDLLISGNAIVKYHTGTPPSII